MKAIRRLLRGPAVSEILKRFGIDVNRYWLLVDLFGQISNRGEMLDQLGMNGVALRTLVLTYGAVIGLLSILLAVFGTPLTTYSSTFLVMTALLLLLVLLSETGNSLVNPVEGLILAHLPIDGATYTAAKLTHLVRMVLYLTPGINLIPALAGLTVAGAGWTYPFFHLLTALAIGFVVASLCCAVYGWLIKLLPARRLRAVGQLLGTVPLVLMVMWQPIQRWIESTGILDYLPKDPAARWVLWFVLGVIGTIIVALGIRSLSADYLIRVTSMTKGGTAQKSGARRAWTGSIVSRWFGGQAGRAGFCFVARMVRRDFQFRRQVIPLVVMGFIGLTPLVASGWRIDPFSGQFSMMHLAPHVLGGLLFLICDLLAYGNDYKGAWVFLLAPGRAFGGFSRGVYAALCIPVIVAPHGIMLPLLAWGWGTWHAVVFVAYSAAVSLVYLALDLRRIEGVPFSRQANAARGASLIPRLIAGSMAAALLVALQHLFVFPSVLTVAAVTAVIGAAAYLLTRRSLGWLENAMRNSLTSLVVESRGLCAEIDV